MPFSLNTVLATTAVSKTTTTVNENGLYTLVTTLANKSVNDMFLLEAIRAYAKDQGIALKEDRHNSYLKVYLIPSLETGAGALTKSDAESSTGGVVKRVALANLTQSQAGTALYKAFSIAGLPAGRQYKIGIELVLNGDAQPDWIAPKDAIAMAGTAIAPPDATLIIEEDGESLRVTVDTLDTSSTDAFLLEVVDKTKADMEEMDYTDSVVLTSKFTFDPENKPVFSYSPLTGGMRKYAPYEIRIRARKVTEGSPDSASDATTATTAPFTLPWLRDFVDNTVIRGRQIEASLVTALAENILSDDDARDKLRAALNSGSYSSVADSMYDMARDVAVSDFSAMGAKFDAVREQLQRIDAYSSIDSEYGELMDLTDEETEEAFMFITKQGYSGATATNYFSWLDKAFHLGPVIEGGKIAQGKYQVTVRGSVYRDRAEIVFS